MVIDFHSHILPQIDDGSQSLEESIQLLKLEVQQGIHHVVATPHFYGQHDTPERFLARRADAENRLRIEMAQYDGLPQLSIGAEVYFFPGISDCDALSELTIAEKSCILIEMPLPPWTDRMYQELEGIWAKQGLTPIIAHIDRYIGPFATQGIPERLEQLPVLVQANASFFLRRSTARMALRMLRQDRIHLLGSDCHNLKTRPPRMGEALTAIQKHLGQAAIDRINGYSADIFGEEK